MFPPERVFSRFEIGSTDRSLVDQCRKLLEEQRQSWHMCRDGYASLASVQTREITASGWSATLQFNSGRIVSTGAKVDAASIKARPCFLCQKNLPAEQRGIMYGKDLMILCNPAPIFDQHFTIPHIDHLPQVIDPYIDTLLQLARDLSPTFTVFYNGPKCGASAPDHFHFQAAPKTAIPVMRDVDTVARRSILKTSGPVTLATLKEYGRTAIILESEDESALAKSLKSFITVWGEILGRLEEPMMNLLADMHKGLFRVVLFLRSKHRPDVYFREGDDRVMISPAAVDIGGLVVTPIEKDFRRVTGTMVEGIYQEVCEDPSLLRSIVERI